MKNLVCAHQDYIGNRTYQRCDRPSARKAWRHRNVPDGLATWLCHFHSYSEHLDTDQWEFTRQRKLNAVGRRCEQCGIAQSALPPGRSGLHVHHRTYERLGEERLDDLEVLCSVCHEQHHGIAVQ